jgi:hypothetical protein
MLLALLTAWITAGPTSHRLGSESNSALPTTRNVAGQSIKGRFSFNPTDESIVSGLPVNLATVTHNPLNPKQKIDPPQRRSRDEMLAG